MPKLTEKLLEFSRMARCRVSDNCVPGFVSGAEWGWGDARNYIAELVRKYPESCVPDKALCFWKDGDRWCCAHGDFVDLESSPCGFGETFEQALISLQSESAEADFALGSAVQTAFGLASGQLKYAERMAATVRLRRKVYAEKLRANEKEAAELDQEIAAIRLMCPHMKTTHHNREFVDDKDWDTCDDCGATL